MPDGTIPSDPAHDAPAPPSGAARPARRCARHGAHLPRFAAVAALLSTALGLTLVAGPAIAARTAAGGTTIDVGSGAYGPMLVVGSGPLRGRTVYFITSDSPPAYGCTTRTMSLLGHPGSCTGPETDRAAEWPALTTVGAPIAGRGVSRRLLGSVVRPGIGRQVTYSGHPLYLFDPGPGQITGEQWDEPSLPPWHGVWYVVSPMGVAAASTGMLTTETLGGAKSVLGAVMNTGIGAEVFTLYTYSRDGRGRSACEGACSRAWPPLLTSGVPGVSAPLDASRVGALRRGDGTRQVTYDGKPLYLYSREGIAPSGAGYAVTGNGNGVAFGGGTFHVVSP